MGHWNEAVELWQRFLELVPDFGEAYANMAGAYWQMGNYENGIRYAKEAIRTCPDLKEGRYNLATNLLLTGQPEAAATIFRDVLRKHPDYMAAQFMLSAVCIIIGKDDQSTSHFIELADRLTNDGLNIALQELIKKLRSNGLNAYADALQSSAQHLCEICSNNRVE